MSARVAHAGEFALSLGLIALGSFIIFETQGIAEAQSYSGVGPRLFPYLIGVSVGKRYPAAGVICRSTTIMRRRTGWRSA